MVKRALRATGTVRIVEANKGDCRDLLRSVVHVDSLSESAHR
jgi:hypothetical protein